jgi:hypothetical protein
MCSHMHQSCPSQEISLYNLSSISYGESVRFTVPLVYAIDHSAIGVARARWPMETCSGYTRTGKRVAETVLEP